MNKILQSVHKDRLIFYIKHDKIYLIDNGIYILKGLLKFKYCLKNGRRVIFVDRNYLNYLLKHLKNNNISYVFIQINYGYNKVFELVFDNNNYKFYFKKGKRMVKNELKISKLLDWFEKENNIDNVKKAIKVIDGG